MSVLPQLVGLLPTPFIKSVARAQWRHPALKRCFSYGAGLLRGRDGRIRKGAGRGLWFNTGSANAGFLLGTSEPAVQAMLRGLLRPGMTVYDIGANVGFLSMVAARLVGSSGSVVCFEPLPANARQLEHNAELNLFGHVSVHCVAVGSRNTTARFVTSAEPTWGRLAGLPGEVAGRTGEIEVPVRTLDSLIEERPLPRPDLIKIDVEGAEADVLRGARQLISSARPLLLIELHGTNAVVDEELRKLSYRSYVIGSTTEIPEAPWDAYVAAAPDERTDLVFAAKTLCYSQASKR